jgi:quercetin dioxygenase-like cupin family protein
MPFIDTNAMEPWERRPGWKGRIYHSANMTFAHWDFTKGSSIHEHHHPNEEVWYVIDGELEITVGGETCVGGPGTVAIVPIDTPHSVVALSDGRALVADHPVRRFD